MPRPSVEFAKTICKPNSVIVEVGVDRGEHARQMCKVLQPSLIYLVDIVNRCIGRFEFTYPHIFIEKHSQVAALEVPNNLDFVYIDGVESEYDTMIDIACWYPKVKIGGVIGGHDFKVNELNGAYRAVKIIFKDFSYNTNEGYTDWWVIKQKERYI